MAIRLTYSTKPRHYIKLDYKASMHLSESRHSEKNLLITWPVMLLVKMFRSNTASVSITFQVGTGMAKLRLTRRRESAGFVVSRKRDLRDGGSLLTDWL
jgi:hypothetical protein